MRNYCSSSVWWNWIGKFAAAVPLFPEIYICLLSSLQFWFSFAVAIPVLFYLSRIFASLKFIYSCLRFLHSWNIYLSHIFTSLKFLFVSDFYLLEICCRIFLPPWNLFCLRFLPPWNLLSQIFTSLKCVVSIFLPPWNFYLSQIFASLKFLFVSDFRLPEIFICLSSASL